MTVSAFAWTSARRRKILREANLRERVLQRVLARREDDPHLAGAIPLLVCLLAADGDGSTLFEDYTTVTHLIHLLGSMPPVPLVPETVFSWRCCCFSLRLSQAGLHRKLAQ